MEKTDWNFDFTKLPNWEVHDSIPYVYDNFIEIPQSDAICCIYSIVEVTMCNYEGFLAIIKNKRNPTLFLNITDGFTFCDNISVSPKGNIIFLQPNIYYEQKNITKSPILIIDIEKSVFSYIKTDNVNPCYKIKEVKENIFKIDADMYQVKHDKELYKLSHKKIQIDHLKWHSFADLALLPNFVE